MQKPKPPKQDDYPPSEATKRRDEALRAALGMPPQSHKAPAETRAKKRRKPAKK